MYSEDGVWGVLIWEICQRGAYEPAIPFSGGMRSRLLAARALFAIPFGKNAMTNINMHSVHGALGSTEILQTTLLPYLAGFDNYIVFAYRPS